MMIINERTASKDKKKGKRGAFIHLLMRVDIPRPPAIALIKVARNVRSGEIFVTKKQNPEVLHPSQRK